MGKDLIVQSSGWMTHSGGSSAHVRHHFPRHAGLEHAGGGKVEHFFQSHLFKARDGNVSGPVTTVKEKLRHVE